ncbi:MAG: hypothetical protein MRJ66_06970 [Nitrospira sp.]|nr:hypothetical protein [Nitrospira sp.]
MKESVEEPRSKIWVAISAAVILGLVGAYWMATLSGEGQHIPQESLSKQLSWGSFDFGGQKYPVVYNREYVAINEDVVSLDLFLPVFSPDRAAVNPAQPRIVVENKRALFYFDVPGEYYLDINRGHKLKVVVLDRHEEISTNVLRVFDFLVANLVVTQGNDKEFYENNENYAIDFFKSKEPKMLLCGPTVSFFEIILRDRFNLPVRDVTFTGVFIEGGRLAYGTHNVVEVFLPDMSKWVLFDLNNGFVAKWMDAFEITEKVRSVSQSKKNISKTEFESIDVDFHYLVDAKRTMNAFDPRSVFYPDMVTRESVRERWHDLAKIFLGGPGYWGGKRFNQNGLPLEYQLYASRYHQDEFLLEAQRRWQDNWDLKVRHVPPAQLKQMLDDAYAEEISARKWLEYLPKPILHAAASR